MLNLSVSVVYAVGSADVEQQPRLLGPFYDGYDRIWCWWMVIQLTYRQTNLPILTCRRMDMI